MTAKSCTSAGLFPVQNAKNDHKGLFTHSHIFAQLHTFCCPQIVPKLTLLFSAISSCLGFELFLTLLTNLCSMIAVCATLTSIFGQPLSINS